MPASYWTGPKALIISGCYCPASIPRGFVQNASTRTGLAGWRSPSEGIIRFLDASPADQMHEMVEKRILIICGGGYVSGKEIGALELGGWIAESGGVVSFVT